MNQNEKAQALLAEMQAQPPAEAQAQVPSYGALLIIAQSVCGALERAGITDCDDPGEAIDVLRERYEAQAQGGSGSLMLATPEQVGMFQGPDDCPHLQINGVSVAVFPAGTWAEVCAAFDSITGSTAPPSAPVGVEGLMQLARNWCLAWGEWAHDADPGCAKENAAEAALRAALTTALAQQPAAVDGECVDWRAMYRFQTAMRYMDNNPNLSKQKADKMADDNVAGLESAIAAQPQGDNT